MQANKQEKQTQSQNILEQDPLPSNDKNSEKNDDSKNQMMLLYLLILFHPPLNPKIFFCRAWSIVIMPKIIAVILFR